MTPEDDFRNLGEVGDPAAYLAKQTDQELRQLCQYAEHLMRLNESKGGWPAVVKWMCVLEAAKRFLKPTTEA